MPTLSMMNRSGQEVGSVELSDAVFAAEVQPVVVREVLNAYEANQRQGTHSTRTWGTVRGGGRKPWKQKGTGRARHGSTRSPIWRGGVVTFGPQPRDYTQKVNRKKRRAALRAVLTARQQEGRLIVVDELDFSDDPKTRRVVEMLDAVGAEGWVLLVTAKPNAALLRAAANIPYAAVMVAGELNVRNLLVSDSIVVTREGLSAIEEALS